MKTKQEFGPGTVVKFAAWVLACAFSGVGSYAETTVTFELLGDLPGGDFRSVANAVSADGSVVVGESISSSGDLEAFRWENGTMVGLGDLPGGDFYSRAYAVSADGSVVVGHSSSPFGTEVSYHESFRWENGTMIGLGYLSGGGIYDGREGVSADGSVVVGGSASFSGEEAFRWKDGTMVGLGDLPGGDFSSRAYAVSADGSVVVGGSVSLSGEEAFRWEDGTMTGLGDLPGGRFSSRARAVSADGSVVVGGSISSSGGEAFRWEDGTMTGLDDLPGGDFWSVAYAVSADGSVVVGQGDSGHPATFYGNEAVFWSENNGWQPVSLSDFLDSMGVDRNGYMLARALAISSYGTTIVGSGVHANGDTEAFRVRILDLEPLIGGEAVNGLPGWYLSEWFGYYSANHAPWLFHAQHGFIYRYPESANASLFFYDDAMGAWWWTSETLYPYLYRFSDGTWLWYQEGSSDPRWFFNLGAESWESL